MLLCVFVCDLSGLDMLCAACIGSLFIVAVCVFLLCVGCVFYMWCLLLLCIYIGCVCVMARVCVIVCAVCKLLVLCLLFAVICMFRLLGLNSCVLLSCCVY